MGSRNNSNEIYDTLKENLVKVIDEMAKIQPQFSQSISNLQIDYIQTAKNIIQNTISAQKQFISRWNIPADQPYTEQIAKQSNEVTNNTIKAVGINNQLAINALDAARENLKIYNRTIDAVTDFNSNIAKAWESFFSIQQYNFSK
jgi:ATP phosphoribosyltransferase